MLGLPEAALQRLWPHTARAPDEAQGDKHSETAAAMMVLLRYDAGVPLNRLGAPKDAGALLDAVGCRQHSRWNRFIARSELHRAQRRYLRAGPSSWASAAPSCLNAAHSSPERAYSQPRRVGSHCSSPVANAGENLTDLLHRAQELEPPVLMCDALARNLPKGHQVVESNCASHGRRHFVDEAENFPSECRYLLEMLGRVFKVDELCRTYRLSDEQRLRLHQRESGPVMEELKLWMEAEFEEKRIEPNSGMGNAINYMLKRWNKFTLFLRRPGAPLHNNIVERTLKRAIRHRNNSLFYRSQRGAHVGDIYMSLIYTTELHGGNAFHYLTTLMLHEKAVADSPSDWLPWNYRESLARLDGLAHHPSTPTDVVTRTQNPLLICGGPPLMAMPRRPPRHHNLNSSAGLSTAASALILSADRPFAGGRPNWPPLEARSFAPHLPRTAAGRTR